MTVRCDINRLIPNTQVLSKYLGHGILYLDLPTGGDSGGSPLLNETANPTDEIRWGIPTITSGSITIDVFEDGSFYSYGGVGSFTYPWWKSGQAQTDGTVNILAPSEEFETTFNLITSSIGFINSFVVDTLASNFSYSVEARHSLVSTIRDLLTQEIGILAETSGTLLSSTGGLVSHSTVVTENVFTSNSYQSYVIDLLESTAGLILETGLSSVNYVRDTLSSTVQAYTLVDGQLITETEDVRHITTISEVLSTTNSSYILIRDSLGSEVLVTVVAKFTEKTKNVATIKLPDVEIFKTLGLGLRELN